MTWSFHISNGDLALSGQTGFAKVTGTQKLVQDLRHWFIVARGSDSFHPDYGSILEGGTLPDGTVMESFIGTTIGRERLLEIESELRRILFAYQEQQLARIRRETSRLGKTTFAPGEILYSVDAVECEQYTDTVLARIAITTQSGTTVTFIQPAG